MKSKIITTYNQRIESYTKELTENKKKNMIAAYLRGAVFLSGIGLSIYLFRFGWMIFVPAVLVFIYGFVFLIKYNNRLKRKIAMLKQLVLINNNETEALNGNYSHFQDGSEYIDYDHPYSYDLDIFGDGSIFQYINRTGTSIGKNLLALWLQRNEKNSSEIVERQNSVSELKDKLDWRQKFQATANLTSDENNTDKNFILINDTVNRLRKKLTKKTLESEKDKNSIINWLDEPINFANSIGYKILLIVMPIVSILMLAASIVGFIAPASYLLIVFVQLGIIGYNFNIINSKHSKVSQKVKILKKYSQLLNLIEKEKFVSDRLSNLQNKLCKEQINVSQILYGLAKIVNSLDNRANILAAFILNILFLWDLQCIVKLEKWRIKYKDKLPEWFSVIAEFDSLSSLSCFAYNNPDFNFPEINESIEFELNAKASGHPLIDYKERVCNDFKIGKLGFITIITGANMAGKSTFLRTIGVNMVLGMVGSVVCADNFIFSPIDMHTSIRTNDSIQKHESYFYAELKRLKEIIDELKKGRKLFVIVDEMLKGTNSKDKHTGSVGLIKNLMNLNASGLAATHDVTLGELHDEYPDNIRNQCFEVEIIGDKLEFSYKLLDGISQNLNATFLMKKMGIIVS